ncbi:MAG TPA: WYL domain-containing protein [Acidimicrobiales bacterium]|nr:WYL domain-containing protein [Acidimicrobiales bacterium]
MDRLERLVNLVAALLDAERPLTREELRKRVGGYSDDPAAFRRNFERDKDVLRQMGLPVVTEVLDAGAGTEDQAGYRIPRDLYELPDPGLTEAELASLRIAAAAVRLDGPWGSEATVSALRKLAAAGTSAPGGDGAASAPEAVGEGVAELAGGEAVAVVFEAITERRRLELTYRGEARTVDPWHLSYRRGKWYLSGFDHRRGEERLYRLDRAEGPVSAVGPAGAYELPAEGTAASAPLPAWRLGDQPETVVRVLVDAVQAPWAEASVGTDGVAARRPDGAVEVELAVSNRDALYSWVIGFLDHAEILGPAEVRDDFVARLEALADEAVRP